MFLTSPMPKHGVNAIDEDSFVVSVKDIITPFNDCEEEPSASRFISGL